MIIKPLDKETYAGRKFTARYKTKGFYDIRPSDFGFRIEYIPFGETVERSFDDEIFSEWLDKPVAFGAFENDVLAGYAEGFLEEWNNRFRISNICIFESDGRGRGIGTRLMETITKEAELLGARMIVLETQSCNEKAIAFYKKNGFKIIGFDLYAYSNSDPERHEVRLEMGKKLQADSAIDNKNKI